MALQLDLKMTMAYGLPVFLTHKVYGNKTPGDSVNLFQDGSCLWAFVVDMIGLITGLSVIMQPIILMFLLHINRDGWTVLPIN